jgi:hypothetical protein
MSEWRVKYLTQKEIKRNVPKGLIPRLQRVPPYSANAGMSAKTKAEEKLRRMGKTDGMVLVLRRHQGSELNCTAWRWTNPA